MIADDVTVACRRWLLLYGCRIRHQEMPNMVLKLCSLHRRT